MGEYDFQIVEDHHLIVGRAGIGDMGMISYDDRAYELIDRRFLVGRLELFPYICGPGRRGAANVRLDGRVHGFSRGCEGEGEAGRLEVVKVRG